MNYYICTNDWRLLLYFYLVIENGKNFATIWLLIYYGTLYLMNCIWTVWYKRKRKDYQGRVLLLFWEVSSNQVKMLSFPLFPLFSSYTTNTYRQFNLSILIVAFLVVFACTPPHHQRACVGVSCLCLAWIDWDWLGLYPLSFYIFALHKHISALGACYGYTPCCSIFGWDTVE